MLSEVLDQSNHRHCMYVRITRGKGSDLSSEIEKDRRKSRLICLLGGFEMKWNFCG